MVVFDLGASVTRMLKKANRMPQPRLALSNMESRSFFRPDSREVLSVQKCSRQRQPSTHPNRNKKRAGDTNLTARKKYREEKISPNASRMAALRMPRGLRTKLLGRLV